MVGYCHRLKSHTLGIFEEGVRPPDLREPLHREEAVLRGHVVREDEPEDSTVRVEAGYKENNTLSERISKSKRSGEIEIIPDSERPESDNSQLYILQQL